jgi:hypothetical protein
MQTNENIEQQLWDYIDGLCNAEEKTTVERLMETNLEWRNKYHELLEVNTLMQSTELEMPSMRFTKNVMEEIAKYQIAPAAKTYINKKIIWGIGLFFITMIIGFLVYGFGQVNWAASDPNTSKYLDISKIDLNKIDFSKFYNSTYATAFMMVNVVLGLFLLDKYLSNKKKAHHKEA